MYAPAAPDGDHYAEIIYSSSDQDEWLITPEVAVRQDMRFSFSVYFQPAFLFDLSDGYVDWDDVAFKERHVAATLQVHVAVDGGEWTLLKDLADDWQDVPLKDMLYETPDWTKMTFDMSAYVGHSVKFAFRYVGKDGDSMFLDDVRVGLPELEPSYANPAGSLFWGFNKEWGVMPYSILMEPVYTPLTWTNTTYDGSAVYSWEYQDAENGKETATYEGEDLTMTCLPDYTSGNTTRNNIYAMPVLTASAPGASDGSYAGAADFFQAGGKAEWPLEDETTTTFGLATCDLLTDGMTIMTVEVDDPAEAATPIFGHNARTTEWWTNHYFDGDQGETDKAEVNGIINFFQSPASPMVIHGLWLNAKGQISENAEFKAEVFPLSDEFVPADEPLAVATCKGSEVVMQEGGVQYYLTVPFVFDTPLVVSSEDFAYYIVKVSGFNSDEVTYFAPLQSALPDATGMCYGWLDIRINYEGAERSTLVPIANFESEFGECYNSFYVNLDATYPWLQGEESDFEAPADGESRTFVLDSYYDGAELAFTADTPDGALPEWLDARVEGRYGETRLTLSVARNESASRSCEVTVSAPGVSKVLSVRQSAPDGIVSVAGNAAEAEVTGVYDTLGRRVNRADRSGKVYVVKHADGRTRKIVR